MDEKKFTPAAGYDFLTPLYDFSLGLVTRESVWRDELARLVAPKPGERILDVGCGTGSLAIRLSLAEPGCEIIGLDPDSNILDIARRKARDANADVIWKHGFLDTEMTANIGQVSRVVSSLVFHQTPIEEKAKILSAMRAVLNPGGYLYVADYGFQRTTLMRTLFRWTVQNLDGVEDTQPNADGCLPEMIQEAGFRNVDECNVIPTLTGSISIYKASAD